ncbi:hypothetical protein PGTUg99_036453 [Puccinia graminis f. sp. tritici]|uniref:Uncharacterized protein n=1 Tax=Puccinia graminis f. sp. tritici TaxID=56615 RepID=A0A5B0N4V0_PUCGR|nr:hypothetical protein PGTUg99_036453 [Puccinia graminis f. sp. tritici]
MLQRIKNSFMEKLVSIFLSQMHQNPGPRTPLFQFLFYGPRQLDNGFKNLDEVESRIVRDRVIILPYQ